MIKNFEVYSDKIIIRGKHYSPLEKKLNKTILMCHGFAGTQNLFLPNYAEIFKNEGFDVITFDYRGFGESDGKLEIIPENQMRDIINVISYIKNIDVLKENKLYLWGTSLGGNYILKIATLIEGISGVYSQITFSNGERNNTASLTKIEKEKYLDQFEKIKYREIKENKGLALSLKKLLTDDQSKKFLETYKEKFPELLEIKLSLLTVYDINKISIDYLISHIKIPVLLLKAKNDNVNLPKEMDYIFKKLNTEKKLLEYYCGHYDVYEGDIFKNSIKEQVEWFKNK